MARPVPPQLAKHAFKKGAVTNPNGRPKLDAETKAILKRCTAKAASILHDILHGEGDYDGAFAKNGWIKPADQLKYLQLALERTMGRPDVVSVEHHGNVELKAAAPPLGHSLEDLDLPERRFHKPKVVDAEVVPTSK